MRWMKSIVGVMLAVVLCVSVAPSFAHASYGMGSYYCAETVTIPGHYITNKFWTFVSAVGGAVGGWGAATAVGATGGVAAGVGAAGSWVLKEITTWVPTTTYCARWEHASRMDGANYNF